MKHSIKNKILSWILVFSLVLPMVSSAIDTQAQDNGVTDYNAMTMQEILARSESLTWVFAGDSITHNGNWAGGMNSYSEWFEQYLYDIDRGRDSVVNSAWGGADITDFLYYSDTPSGNGAKADAGMGLENFITKYNPDVVFIKLGMNNRGMTTDKFIEYYELMLRSIYAEGAKNNKVPKIVILTPTPLASENIYDEEVHTERDDAILETVLRYQVALKELAKNGVDGKGELLFCDLRGAFLEEQKRLGEDYAHTFFSDSSDGGIHPNAAGQYLIFKTLSKAIEIYDDSMPIFQFDYEDMLSVALYTGNTDGVTYSGSYGVPLAYDDDVEMNKSIPEIKNAQVLASIDFNADNGVLNKEYIDLVNDDDVQNPLTLQEVQSMGNEYTVAFRAKLSLSPNSGNQSVFYLGAEQGVSWGSTESLMLNIPGKNTGGYYLFRNEDGAASSVSGFLNHAEVNGSAVSCNNISTFVSSEEWHTYVLVQSSDKLTVYVDGQPQVWVQQSGSNYNDAYLNDTIGNAFKNAEAEKFEAYIGRLGSGETSDYTTYGSFDYWQLYDGELTATDVRSLCGETAVDDAEEMNKTMPAIDGIDPLSSVEFTSASGELATAGTKGFDIATNVDTEDVKIHALTLEDVKTLEKEFTVVFRAKLETPDKANSPILTFSSDNLDTSGWDNAFTLGVQGNADQCYYQMRKGGSNTYVGGSNTFSIGTTTTAGDGQWHTIAIVQRTDSFEYYVDGVLAGSNTAKVLTENIGTTFADATSLTARIGYYGSSAAAYDLEGCFDYWQFYGQALSAENVAALVPTVTADDTEEMQAAMPTLESNATLLASVDLDNTNGVFNGGDDYAAAHKVDLTDDEICQDPMTLTEAQSLTNEFSVVFRARLEESVQVHQAILMLSPTEENWKNALSLGVPSTSNSAYYEIRQTVDETTTEMTNSSNVIGMSGGNQSVDGNWHTIALVQSADSFTYYLDGEVFYTNSYTVNEGFNIGDLFTDASDLVAHIGSFSKSDAKTYNLKGNLDYFQFYSGVLSGTQIASMADANPNGARTINWSKSITENYVWGVAGAKQMSGYEGASVHHSLFRYLDNAMRGGGNTKSSQRDIRMYSFASPKYNGVQDLIDSYDSVMAIRNYDVFLLLPEIPDVYERTYVHSADLVAEYKADVLELLEKNSGKVQILWTPLASGDENINSYIDDYARAVTEIAAADTSILFFDANKFMNENMAANMAANSSLVNNWFEDGAYISPLCAVDVAYAFYTLMNQSGINKSELSDHNLRYTSDLQVYKGNYVRDYIKADANVNGTEVTVDVKAITDAYPSITNLRLAYLPTKGAGNYHAGIRNLEEIGTVTEVDGVYTFQAPCADLNLAIYGEQDGLTYRFKDISLTVDTEATIPEKVAEEPDGVYLNSLEVMSAPDFGFAQDKTEYTVDLYQYQTYARVRATAQAGLTITVNGETVASNALSDLIQVENGSVITVAVTDGTETVTYTLNCSKPETPDIIITEVMQDGYAGYTKSGNDNYELVEIYNASGEDLNLLDYSLGFKKDYTYNNVTVSNGAEYPYYFTGNDQAFGGNASHTGIKPLTKYSIYWKDKVDQQPDKVIFPADSTMVIWLRYAPQSTQAAREEYGAALTYDTLIAALETHKGTHTLSVDVDGTDTAVVPKESQLVVAELPNDCQSGGVSSRAQVNPKNAQMNYYMDNFGGYYNYQSTRGWLFLLKDTAQVALNGTITKDGDDIISAAKFSRAAKVIGKNDDGTDKTQGTNKLSSVFCYNYERGMSLVKNENVVNVDTIGEGNTSDVMGYSNLTSFGAIEYWQKPTDFGDEEAPVITNNTATEVAYGAEGQISLSIEDHEDVRYIELYTRKAGETEYTKVKKDLVLEAGIKNDGVSTDITSTTYEYAVGTITDTVEYYALVVDGNNNTATLGTEAEPLTIGINVEESIHRHIQEYSATDAKTYVGVKAPDCEEEGYLFAGWYADEKCITTPIRTASAVSGTSYALFISDDVLSIQAQLSANMADDNATNDGGGKLRFVTTVDTLNYKEVGFNVSFDKDGDGTSETLTRSSNEVYTELYAIGTEDKDPKAIEPTAFCDISTYFKACTVSGITENYKKLQFTVTPFWTTLDGITVDGVTAVKSANQGIQDLYEAKTASTYYKELEAAVTAANADAENATVTVIRNAEVESEMSISSNVTIQNDAGTDVTIHRGSGLASSSMFNVASGATLTISGVEDRDSIVLDGRTVEEVKVATSRDDAIGSTATLIYNAGTLNLSKMTAQYVRRSSGHGAVINSTVSGATVGVNDVKFDNNTAAGSAGAILLKSGANANIQNTEFANNSATHGGAIEANTNGTVTISNCTFNSNKTTNGSKNYGGGAIYNWYNTIGIENCMFTGNASAYDGGAIYNNGGTLNINGTDSTKAIFQKNTASNWAGAIYTNGGKLTVDGYNFDTNKAKYGGAIIMFSESEISNTTFKSNEATTNEGGAIYANKQVTFTDCIFDGNVAKTNGGAICCAGNVTYTFVANDSNKAMFKNNISSGSIGGAIYLYKGTLAGSGYTFSNNTPEDICRNTYYDYNANNLSGEYQETTCSKK